MSNHILVGLRTDEYVILAADKLQYANNMIISSDHDKSVRLSDKLYMSVIGNAGGVQNFVDRTCADYRLQKIQYNYEMSPKSTHQWLRNKIVNLSRASGSARDLNLLLAGYDNAEGKAWLSGIYHDGNSVEGRNYLAHGSQVRYYNGLMNTLYKKDMTLEEGLNAVKQCITGTRSMMPKFSVVVIDKGGSRTLDDITA